MLAQLGPMLGHLGPTLSLSWPYVGLSWAKLSLSWAYVGHLGDMLGLSRPMLLDGHGRSGGAESIVIYKVKVRPGFV